MADAGALNKSGPLRILSSRLPVGRIGADYSACIVAAGGEPWVGTTRPGKTAAGGKGRYWEFPLKTLVAAAAADSVDFKKRDDAIPAIKTYLDGARYNTLNQTSVWLGSAKGGDGDNAALGDVGYSQDAKKELEALVRAKAIDESVQISKPARLMARLLALFDNPHGYVIDIGSPAAEMASISTAMGRPTIYVEVNQSRNLRIGLLKKRIAYAASGLHPIPDVVNFLDAPRSDESENLRYWVTGSPRAINQDSRPFEVSVAADFASVDRTTGTCLIDYQEYPEGSRRFLDALASMEGLVPFVVESLKRGLRGFDRPTHTCSSPSKHDETRAAVA